MSLIEIVVKAPLSFIRPVFNERFYGGQWKIRGLCRKKTFWGVSCTLKKVISMALVPLPSCQHFTLQKFLTFSELA